MNILHISDIHFRKAYESCEEGYMGVLCEMQSPLIPLEYCLKKVQKTDKIDLLIISGDLTEDGEAADYEYLQDYINSLVEDTKIIVTLGNHDNKDKFRVGWLKEEESNSPYNQVVDLKDLFVISFDTSVHGNPNGQIDERQLKWLKEAFLKTEEKPVILVTHHHLLEEQIALPPVEGRTKFQKEIKDKNIICILNGHTHHSYIGELEKKACFTAGSLSFCGEDQRDGSVRFDERYGYNFYRVEEGKIVDKKIEVFETGRTIKTIYMW